jgi:Na+-transporting methylmalonyl-CoA/oxaloacetate decarboxylase gamma subunit
MKKKKPNWKVVISSIIGLGFIVLTFLIHWMFIIGAVVVMLFNQKELNKTNS